MSFALRSSLPSFSIVNPLSYNQSRFPLLSLIRQWHSDPIYIIHCMQLHIVCDYPSQTYTQFKMSSNLFPTIKFLNSELGSFEPEVSVGRVRTNHVVQYEGRIVVKLWSRPIETVSSLLANVGEEKRWKD